MNRAALSALATITVAWLWFCWPLLTGQAVGYRDAVYLYGPLFQYLDMCHDFGLSPMWNPFDNFGEPLAANGSAALFYPLRWVVQAIPISAIDQLSLYTALHLYLAMLLSFRLALSWGIHPGGAALSALAYGLGGSVLFQVTNVIYLVGATWLPLAWMAGERMVLAASWQRGLANAALAALACGMMLLGGDPQMAYHAWLILAITIVFRGCRRSSIGEPPQVAFWRAAGLGILVVGLSYGLAAVQMQISREWLPYSERSLTDSPRSLYELIFNRNRQPLVSENPTSSLGLSEPEPDSHLDHVYQFSQPPWTLLEFIWPNLSGHPFPENTRWVDALPGAERMWVPSLYCGGLVFVLALHQLRFRRGDRHSILLSWLAVLFAAGALGWYGIGWLLHECGWAKNLGSPVGGVYWFFVMVLPDYVLFRYPAKLMVVVQLAIALLAGKRFSELIVFPSQTKPWLSLVLLGLSLFAVALFPIFSPSLQDLVVPDDEIAGAFQPRLAAWHLFSALLHGCIVFLGAALLIFWNRHIHRARGWWIVAGLSGVFIDLAIANRGMIPTIPKMDLEVANQFYSPGLFNIEPNSDAAFTDLLSVATRLGEDYLTSSEPGVVDPLRRTARLQQIRLFPKHHLGLALQACLQQRDSPTRVHGSFSSIESWQTAMWQSLVGTFPPARINFVTQPPIVAAQHGRNPHAKMSRAELQNWFTDAYHHFVVESNESDQTLADSDKKISFLFPERVSWLAFRPTVVQIQCETPEPGWVLLCDLYAPGWKAQIMDLDNQTTREVEVQRMQGIFRAVAVPAGRFQVVFYYQPDSLIRGRIISVATYVVIVVLLLVGNTASRDSLE